MKGLRLRPLFSAMTLTLALSACSDNSDAQNQTKIAAAQTSAQMIAQHGDNPFFKQYGTVLLSVKFYVFFNNALGY